MHCGVHDLVRPPRLRVSYHDLPSVPAEGPRYELHDGEVFAMPRPTPLHQIVVLRVVAALETFRQRHGGLLFCAPLDLLLSDYDVLQPDVMFYKKGREQLVDLQQPLRVPCDLAVEVTLPATATDDRGRKMQLLARHGVREYWLVDPDARRVEVLWLIIDTYGRAQTACGPEMVRSTILPGLLVQAKAFFE
jgi:Uma2 family endonuclease